jgi:PKD repeat protein
LAICGLVLVVVFTILTPATITTGHFQPTAANVPDNVSFGQSSPNVVLQPSTSSQSTLNYSFRDNFDYANMSQMQTAGWTECGSSDRASVDYQVSPSLLTLVSDWDNNTSPAVCWNRIPSGISNWSVSTREAWVGNNIAGTIQIIVTTSSHTYNWDADGMFNRYILWRDGYANGGVWTSSNVYTAQLGVWHNLRMDFVKGTFYLYFDDLPMATVPVQDTGTNLTGIILRSPAGTDNSFSYVQASSVNPNAPDFTLIAGPTSQNIPVGQNATFTVSLASVNGFSGIVNLAATVSPSGSNSIVISLSPSVRLTAGGSASVSLTVTTLLVISASTFNIRVNATSGALYHAIQVSATVTGPTQGQNFTLRASPGSMILYQKGNGAWTAQNITIYITGVSGFAGTVALSARTDPPGPVWTIDPSQVLVSGNKTFTATLSFQSGGSGTWQFYITAVSAGLSVTTSASVDFIPSYFTSGVTPSLSILVSTGSSTTVSLNLVSVNGYTSNVSLSYYSVYALPASPPIVSFSPVVTLLPNITLSVPVIVSASSNTPIGSYTFIIRENGGWAFGDSQINVYVVAHPYALGVSTGTTATYNVSLSSYPGVPISITVSVTNVAGPVVSYAESFYVDNVLTNTTSESFNIVTGEHSGTVFVPFPFVASSLHVGDALFPATAYGSITIGSTLIISLAGRSRLAFSAGTGLTINPVQVSATWDSLTGILGTLDGTVPINSTSVTAHYRLVSTNAWPNQSNSISVQFIVSRPATVLFLIVTFTPTITGGVAPYTYHWDFGDGQSSSRPNPTHSYGSSGSYKVTLTVTDENGVRGVQTSTVRVSSSIISLPFLSTFAPTIGTLMIGLVALGAYGLAAIAATIVVIRREQAKWRRLAQRPANST